MGELESWSGTDTRSDSHTGRCSRWGQGLELWPGKEQTAPGLPWPPSHSLRVACLLRPPPYPITKASPGPSRLWTLLEDAETVTSSRGCGTEGSHKASLSQTPALHSDSKPGLRVS